MNQRIFVCRRMSRQLTFLGVVSCWIASTATAGLSELPPGFLGDDGILTRSEVADGWIALFDGQTMYGWRPQKEANWRVEDGTLVADAGKSCLLCTTTQFADYVLRVEFRGSPTTNSGLFLRTSPVPSNVTQDCYELNIAPPENPFPTGSLVQRLKFTDAKADDQWHQFEVTMVGGEVTIKLDGAMVLAYSDPEPTRRGYIGLQYREGPIAFRHVKLKPIGLQPLQNGKDLTGWKGSAQLAASFAAHPDGTISTRGGKGQLETEGTWGDFVLQFDAITHGFQVNSGLFVRCIPGEELNGYETQIQHGMINRDPLRPLDAGTGAIFRRTQARRVVPEDFTWFHETVIANGPHFAVWVNGYQVTDWVDRRKPNDNPRRGQRTAPGSIMLQGHDETTAISFRDLRIVEMPKRR